MRVSNFDRVKQYGPLSKSLVTPDRPRLPKKKSPSTTINTKEKRDAGPPSTNERTQVEDSYEFPAVFFLVVPSDS